MTQINKGQARANEVHARNEAKFIEKHGHARPGKGKKSDQTVEGKSSSPIGLNTASTGQTSLPATTSTPATGSTPNIARAIPTGGSNDTVAYLEGAIDDVINVQKIYNQTYKA